MVNFLKKFNGKIFPFIIAGGSLILLIKFINIHFAISLIKNWAIALLSLASGLQISLKYYHSNNIDNNKNSEIIWDTISLIILIAVFALSID